MALDPLAKTREALMALAVAADLDDTATLYDGEASAEKQAPCVGFGASNATEEPANTGNYWVDAEAVIKWRATVNTDLVDPKTAKQTFADLVIAALERPDLATELSAAVSGYTVFGFGDLKEITQEQEGDCWVTRWRRRLYCCCSSL